MPKRRKGARRQQQKLKKESSLSAINQVDDDDDDDEENRRSQDHLSVIKQKDYASRHDTKNDNGIISQTTNRLTRLATSSLKRKIKIRDEEDSAPRSKEQRRWELIRRWSSTTSTAALKTYRKQSIQTQYRISAATETKVNSSIFSRLKHCIGCWSGSRFDAFTYDSVVGHDPNAFFWGCDINRMIAAYLSWSFRASFFILFLSLNIGFFSLIIIFTFLMMLLGQSYPECFEPTYNEADTPFADAYALSWTTFTTVGYGHTYPAKGVDEPDQGDCFMLHVLCSFESFVGVIWAGCCGAIIFGKILRVQSLAPIIFSDPITVQYGKGLKTDDNVSDENLPCPVLTIRMANMKGDQVGGEVVDGLVHLIAITHECSDNLPKRKRRPSDEGFLETVNEDPGYRTNIMRTFQKLLLDNSDNPYFKRVWTVNHVLNHESPLLIPEVRDMIRETGRWPEHLNSAEKVRESIVFDQIFVSFSGISVVCADSVYAQHMYNYEDMNIGYKFVPMLFRDREGIIRADFEILNDVVEQRFGGGEPLIFGDTDFEQNIRDQDQLLMNGYKIEGEEIEANVLSTNNAEDNV